MIYPNLIGKLTEVTFLFIY